MIQKLKQTLVSDHNLKELLTGSSITFVLKVFGMILSYLVVILISTRYGADGVGLYSVTFRTIRSVALISALGFNISVLRYVGEFNTKPNKSTYYKRIFKTYCSISLPFSVVIGILLFATSDYIALNIFENENYSNSIQIIAIILPLFTLNLINIEFIRGLKSLKVSEYLRSANTYIIILFVLIIEVLDLDLLNAIYALAFGIVVTFAISFLFIFAHIQKLPQSILEISFSRNDFIKTSLPMLVTEIASFILAFSGIFFLEIFSTTEEVGIYSVCIMLSQLVSLVLTVVNTISAPKFSELFWANKRDDLNKLLKQSSKLIFWSSFAISLLLTISSKLVLNFFGQEFTIGRNILIILILGQLINAITGSVGIFLNMTGHQKVLRNIIFVTALFILMGYYYIIPIYGLLGAAIISVIGTLIINVFSACYVYFKLNYITFYIPFITLRNE
ncbi:oligosaccharide flippase family protein [Winogradskyella aquimaris]|uniref:Oligosaccharide flippase family protein n=1 Tax=Winogradskyella aquimaris TaxID=864074 RepID=A0ABU5EJQ8_9FLAO|nr:oligosaccharide flippase family protein [Winogradskyella aquimaris]MDY2586483.1 oligosaccharide flippase family protein [Winogradskyella aquimaris]